METRMMKSGFFLGVVLILAAHPATAGIGVWKNYTSMKEVRGVAREGNLFWAATSGGLFSWNQTTGTYQLFTNAEGLQNFDLTAVGIDSHGNIWTGTSTGVIHVYSPSSQSWRYILNIAGNGNQTNKKINAFTMYRDTVLICTEFGLSMFDSKKFQFGDTYSKFGTLPTTLRIAASSAVIFNGKIWTTISTGQGNGQIAVGDLATVNLLQPESWSLQSIAAGSVSPTSLLLYNNRLYASTTGGLFYLDNNLWTSVSVLDGKNIVAASTSPTTMALCTTSFEVFTLNTQNDTLHVGSLLPNTPSSIAIDDNGKTVIGSLSTGLLTFASAWDAHIPNGPNGNQFTSIASDANGVVWCASGSSNGKGFYRFNGMDWKSFTRQNSQLPLDEYYRVSVGCNGSVWASSWSRGFVEIPDGVDSVDTSHIFGRNVGMVGIPNDPNYIVGSTVECDRQGNVWMTSRDAANTRILVIRKTNDTWITSPVLLGGTRLKLLQDAALERSFALDASGNMWAVVRDPAYAGVIRIGNRPGIDTTVQYHITSADGLPGTEIRTIIVDRDNDIWVGTDGGIGIIFDPDNPKRAGSIAIYKPLLGQIINTISVDPLNQKWVGTTEGAILLSQDGTQVLASYTVDNTGGKLIDNDIKSITIDVKKGIVYFGTTSGLASLSTTAIEPKASFDKLLISPNPYIVPNTALITIDGLVENSSIKVLSIDGRLIREIKTPGGRIGFWDGKDAEDKDVASGIYIITAYSEDGTRVATSKVAVVRR